MKAGKYLKTLLLLTAAFVFATLTYAQDNRPGEVQPQDVRHPGANQPQDMRMNVLRQLGLSPEQVQQIRKLNAERKPLMVDAQNRLREANRALDDAIYGDQVHESDVQARLKEVQSAQGEVAKVRFMNELSVRRILTPEQLVRFRELRQRFEQARRDLENRRSLNRERRMDRPRRGNGMRTPQDAEELQRRPMAPDPGKPNF